MDKPNTIQLRKWHFLFVGVLMIFLSAFLWYWNWRTIGLPNPLKPEHYLNLAVYLVGILILGMFIYRLRKSQVRIMLVGMIVVNVIAALVTVWINRTYPAIFELMAPFEISVDPVYIADWGRCFLRPALWSIHIGLLVLWIESLIMYQIREPGHEPG